MSKWLILLVCAGVLCLSGTASAALINWTLSGVTFSDGATASGDFTMDTVAGHVVSLSILTTGTGGNNTLKGYYYTMDQYSGGGTQSFTLYDWDHDQNLFILTFDCPLTTYSTTAYFLTYIPGVTSGSWEGFIGGPTRFVTSGYVFSAPAPPPPATTTTTTSIVPTTTTSILTTTTTVQPTTSSSTTSIIPTTTTTSVVTTTTTTMQPITTTTTAAPCADSDADGVCNNDDNCPNKPNGPELGTCMPGSDKAGASCQSDADCVNGCSTNGTCSLNQEDTDADGKGDVCDNCPAVCNPQQLDANGNGIGDLCDPDPGCGGGCTQPACEPACGIQSLDNAKKP